MEHKNLSDNFSKFFGSAVVAGIVAIIGGILTFLGCSWTIYAYYTSGMDTQQQLDNQQTQIAQQQTQIALIAEQNQLQHQQLTLDAQKTVLDGQILTKQAGDGNVSQTDVAFFLQATQAEVTRQAIEMMQTAIAVQQTAAVLTQQPVANITSTPVPRPPTYTPYPTLTPYPTAIPPTPIPPTPIPATPIPPTAPLYKTTFIVVANQIWQGTGVIVNPGDVLIIQYVSGLWRWTGDRADYDGNGDPIANGTYLEICTTKYDCPIADAPLQSLVGRIGINGTPFLIGNSLTFAVPSGSESNQMLYLVGNDSFSGLHDNVGSIEVSIAK